MPSLYSPPPVDRSPPQSASDAPAAPDESLNHLNDHYAGYYSSELELKWFGIAAADKARNVMDLAARVPHDSILDIGSGDGAVLQLLDQAGFGSKLHAVEISSSGLEALGKKNWKSLVEARAFDGYHIPYPDNSFDLAVLSHVVEHVEHPRLLLYEAARVARAVYIEVPLEFVRSNRRMRRDFAMDSTGHINFFSPDLIRLLVQSSGLRVIRQETRHTTSVPYRFRSGRKGLFRYAIKEWLLRLAPRLATNTCVYHGALLCERAAKDAPAPH